MNVEFNFLTKAPSIGHVTKKEKSQLMFYWISDIPKNIDFDQEEFTFNDIGYISLTLKKLVQVVRKATKEGFKIEDIDRTYFGDPWKKIIEIVLCPLMDIPLHICAEEPIIREIVVERLRGNF